MRNARSFLLIPFLCFLPGCSLLAPSEPGGTSIVPVSLDIFAARGFLGGSDYERYVMKNGVLWRECGSVLPKSKPGDDSKSGAAKGAGDVALPRDPSLSIQQRRVEVLKPEDQGLVLGALRTLLETPKGELPGPESVFSLADGGIFEVKVEMDGKSLRAVTNVDAVSDSKTDFSAFLAKVFTAVRTIGPTICRSETFFGVGKSRR